MAFSGITLSAICNELNNTILNGKIQKISQPEEYGIIFNIHSDNGNYKLYISANASLPLIYLTDENKSAPLSAFNFVMVLRKHIGNARITEIKQFGLERVIRITLEHLDELKDIAYKYLYVEIMGKYSNIIFTDSNNKIIDAIKHIGYTQSSVREVLPGREYFITSQNNRLDGLNTDEKTFYNKVLLQNKTIEKAISSSFVGFSAITGREIAIRASLDFSLQLSTLHESEKKALWIEFEKLINDIKNKAYSPIIVFNEKNKAIEYSAFYLSLFEGSKKQSFSSISTVIKTFYEKKNNDGLIKQKATDLRKIVLNAIERSNKKLSLQKKQFEDTEKKDKLRLYGELLQTYGYQIKPNSKEAIVENYYDNNNLINIPLDETLSAIDNSKIYFKKYDKLKRTRDALLLQIEKNELELNHLSTIETSLSLSETEDDLNTIREELFEYGYIKKRPIGKKQDKNNTKKNPPLHYKTKEGFDLYVGKNNFQNEEVTFKIAKGDDWWFHAKQMTGSHVILKNDGRDIPDNVFEAAANLAAYYSSGRESTHVEVDYVQRKEIKRVPKAAKGFVIYYTNYSIVASPDISSLSIIS